MNTNHKHIDIELLTRYLANELPARQRTDVEEWINASQENRAEFESLLKVWNETGKQAKSRRIDVDTEWDYLQSRINLVKRSDVRWFRVVWRVAAAILLLGAVLIYTIRISGNVSEHTGKGETIAFTLSDGSTITLNSDSKLTYSKKFGESYRRVKLRGEAYFEVERDTLHPFIVEMNGAELTVLGTSFNVRAYESSDEIEVTVTEGKVKVYDRKTEKKQVVATAGEKAVFNRASNAVEIQNNDNINYDAWKTRNVVFNDADMSEVVETLSRVYHAPVELGSETLKSCTVTVSFENKDLNTVINVLESTLGITVEKHNDKLIITGDGC